METGPRVFLSHASDDKPEVNELYRRLSAAGFQPWTVQMNVGPGEPWRVKVEQAINECDFFLAILSRATVHVGAFAQEWTLARKRLQSMPPHTVFLIPTRLEDTPIPTELSEFQCVDLFEPAGWDQLIRAMGGPRVPKLPTLVPPAELIEACRKGDCVAYVGAGLSKEAGYPGWQEMVKGLLNWAISQRFIDSQLGASYQHALESGQVDLVADGIVSAVQAHDPMGESLKAYLTEIFLTPSISPTPVHKLLPQIGFAAALTTNFDSLLEQTFNDNYKKTNIGRSNALLRQKLIDHFDEQELRTLCFDLGLDYESLPARGKASKVRELVAYLDRAGRRSELFEKLNELRPEVKWTRADGIPHAATPSSASPRLAPSSCILIVTVTKGEAQAVLKAFSQAAGQEWGRKVVGHRTYYDLGIHGGESVFMVHAEIGTVTPGGALLTVRRAIQDLQPLAVIMCGIAFGLHPGKHQLGDILVARQVQYYWSHKADLGQGQILTGDRMVSTERLLDRFRDGSLDWVGAPTHFGLVLSGEKLIADSDFRNWLAEADPEAIGVEIEGAGLYVAARDAHVDCILVKAIGGWVDGRKGDDPLPLAANNAAQFVLHVIQLGGWAGLEQSRLSILSPDRIPVYTSQNSEELTAALAQNEFFILGLSGTLQKAETLQITPSQYGDTIAGNRAYAQFIERLFFTRTLLFMGASLGGILSHLDAFQIRSSHRQHYALVAVAGTEWRAQADRLQRRYNVQVLPYQESENHSEVREFLSSLAEALAAKIVREPGTSMIPLQPPKPLHLKRVELYNIGPFDRLELDLDSRWNILLGDNGVGKSNILKAIALAICGRDAQPYADRLIKSHQSLGRITLETTYGETNVVELKRAGNTMTGMEADMEILSQREWMGAEQWLALGFPPLRQMSWNSRPNLQSASGRPHATSGDLLPLVLSDLDPRMEDFKDTIFRLEVQAGLDKNDRPRRVRDAIFQVISSLAEGMEFGFCEIDMAAGRIWVMTDDGEVPIEAVSQGTQSLLGWVGVLVKRLFEVYEGEDQPLHKPAVVLIDEIDAHMHPAWQRTIARKLLKLFPNVQFIATTHSPLVVAEAERQQVFRLIRDPESKRIRVCSPDEDVQGMGAGALLTSDLFGLPSQLDQTTQEKLDRRRYLAGKPFKELSKKEREELQGLSSELESMGFNYEFRDPLYSRFLKAWAHETKGEQEWGATPLTREQAERQAELTREIVAMLKSRTED